MNTDAGGGGESGPAKLRRLTRKRLVGIDRSGPEPPQTRAGQPLRPFTLPNLIGYLRLAALPFFCILAFDSGDGRDATAALIFFAVAFGDYLDGFLARATGQYSRLGALLDPVVDRLTVLCGAAVCWHFHLLPRWALLTLALRELITLVVARRNLSRGIDIEINWVGRFGVFLVMGGIFWSMVLDWLLIEVGFVIGVATAIAANVLYARATGRRLAERAAAALTESIAIAATGEPE